MALAVVGHDQARGARGIALIGKAHTGRHLCHVLLHLENDGVGGRAVVLHGLASIAGLNGSQQVDGVLGHAPAQVELDLGHRDLRSLAVIGGRVHSLGDLLTTGLVSLLGVHVVVQLAGGKIATGQRHVGVELAIGIARPGAARLIGVLKRDDNGVDGTGCTAVIVDGGERVAVLVALHDLNLELQLTGALINLVGSDLHLVVIGVVRSCLNGTSLFANGKGEVLTTVGGREAQAIEHVGDGAPIGVQTLVGRRHDAVLGTLQQVNLRLGGLIVTLGLEGELAGAQGAAVQNLLDVKAALFAQSRGGAKGIGEAATALGARTRGLGRQLATGIAHLNGKRIGMRVVVPAIGIVGNLLGDAERIGAHLVEDQLVKADGLRAVLIDSARSAGGERRVGRDGLTGGVEQHAGVHQGAGGIVGSDHFEREGLALRGILTGHDLGHLRRVIRGRVGLVGVGERDVRGFLAPLGGRAGVGGADLLALATVLVHLLDDRGGGQGAVTVVGHGDPGAIGVLIESVAVNVFCRDDLARVEREGLAGIVLRKGAELEVGEVEDISVLLCLARHRGRHLICVDDLARGGSRQVRARLFR